MTIGIMRGIISLLLLIPTNGDPKGHPPPGAPAADPPAYVAGEIILELSDGGADALRSRLSGSPGASDTGHPTLDALGRRYGVRQIRAVLPDDRARGRKGPRPRMSDFFLLRLAEGQDALEALDEYRADPLVESVQLNYLYEPDLIPNDPLYPSQYAHAKTQAAAGWDIETGDPAVVIAIMGTGVSATHPDLAYRLVTGWDFVDDDTDPSPAGDGHETSVAGVAGAAANNLTGVAGVCWGCGLMPLRIDYTTTDVAQAIDFAVTNGARVVNMSFGNYDINKYGPDTVVETAVDDGFAAGVVMVATAGNDAISTKRYPGALDNVIGVSSTDAMDERAGFSNFGDWVDVAAPGQAVYSTLLNGGFGTVNGTSFSAPYVAGLAGLVLSKDPLLTPSQVRLIVEYTTDPLDADRYIGTGRVNVARALAQNGVPQLFALIKSPVDGDLSPGPVDVFGTVLGDGFILEYRPQGGASWTAFAAGSQTIDGLLGTLPTGALGEGTYEIRLTAAHGSDQAEDIVAFYLGGAVQEGWPVNVGSAIISPLSYADLDGDGLPEILVGGTNTLVHVFRHDGTYFPGWPRSTSGIVFSSPSVGDIDGDGDSEVVVTTYLGAMLYAWHHDGTGVSGFPVAVGSGPTAYMRGSACLVNLDADPALEIIAAASD
ncbi:MAG TPA: S8 family serine peptidase, partial [Candidatus Polarisedimenticolia bacterium]|nr:S8 family serine peptidase [Candidatus Polarisedimenticolia bacterium]